MTLHECVNAIAALIFIIVLIFCTRPLLRLLEQKKSGARGGQAGLSLVGQMALDRTRRLSVVRYGAREVLVLTGGNRDILMDWTERETFASALDDSGTEDVA
ncbi:flagellar biosynthetic protein FliO [Gluconobacter sp. Dm-62]|uniref:flagellar biosynthetic protein FliO n=1 Tax=Gluconobacter sp. Dm-62 TaxID=2799804 RepID=UPI001B8D3066|nr:flagellar biosynthetic protein FliO [Gluconobacter sp. Dm-62]MBS1103784.1 flagellar biosynthetic protein FliO [Gluconobacter sp. Dm-62]